MRSLFEKAFIAGLTCASALAVAREQVMHPCPQIELRAPEKFKFQDTERHLICGDPKNPPWSEIPQGQALFSLKVFLQQRGYQDPKVLEEGPRLVVDAGKALHITNIQLEGQPKELRFTEYRGTKADKLTPKKLDEIELWIRRHLEYNGYPCPLVKSEADPVTGRVLVHIDPGLRTTFGEIDVESVPGLDPGILRRYDAFHADQLYDRRLLSLTERRTLADGVVLSTYFLPSCDRSPFAVEQRVTVGYGRLVTLGAGFDTQQYLFAHGTWKAHRLGRMASTVTLEGDVSYRRQLFNLTSDWYVLPRPSRFYLAPSLRVERRNEAQFDTLEARLRIAPSVRLDTSDVGIVASVGPSLNSLRTFRSKGGNREHYNYLSLSTALELRSHEFEFYLATPLLGYRVTFSADLNHQKFLSQVTAQELMLSGEALWNFKNFDPPLWVWGVRSSLATTLPGEHFRSPGQLSSLRHYLGGSENLRGFARNQLPVKTGGALTAAYLGFEARFKDVAHVEPLAFVDFGGFGQREFRLDSPLFWSPGVGFRWKSPVGAVRGTAARGYATRGVADLKLPRWQFFVSLGEEF